MATSLLPLLSSALLPLLVGVGLSYLAYTVIYRLWFHPLAKFPGPRLAACTAWYEAYYDILYGHGGQFMLQIRKMHEQYGPIVRINPDELHIQDPDYFEVLYAPSPARRDKYEKTAKSAGTPLGTFGTIGHDLHRKRRQANSYFFSTNAIFEAEDILQTQVQLLSEKFRGAFDTKEVLELRVHFIAFSTDIITHYAFGKPMALQKDREAAENWQKTIKAIGSMIPVSRQFPWLQDVSKHIPLPVLKYLAPDLAQTVQLNLDMISEAGAFLSSGPSKIPYEEAKQVSGHVTLFQSIFSSKVPDEEKAQLRMANEGIVVIGAGSETSSRLLTILTFHLLDNPHVLERLRQELDTAMPDPNGRISIKESTALPYLSAVVKEALRLSAIITSRTPVRAYTELQYKNWTIPARTPVSLTIHDTLMSEQAYSNPRKFDPERWLQPNPPDEKYFVPFGKGTRMCQGMRLALTELNLVVATLFRRFELELYDTVRERDVDFVRDCFVGEHHPSSLGVRARIVGVRK